MKWPFSLPEPSLGTEWVLTPCWGLLAKAVPGITHWPHRRPIHVLARGQTECNEEGVGEEVSWPTAGTGS